MSNFLVHSKYALKEWTNKASMIDWLHSAAVSVTFPNASVHDELASAFVMSFSYNYTK